MMGSILYASGISIEMSEGKLILRVDAAAGFISIKDGLTFDDFAGIFMSLLSILTLRVKVDNAKPLSLSKPGCFDHSIQTS